MIEIKFDITNAVEAEKVKSLIQSMYGTPVAAMQPAPVAVTPVQAPVNPTMPQTAATPALMAQTAPAPTDQAHAATAYTHQPAPAPAAPPAQVDLSDAGLQMLVQRVAQAGIAVPTILQELQLCGATKISELQPQMRQAFRDKLVALTGGAVQ